MNNRFRRLRSSKAIRDLVRETDLAANDLVQPYFVIEGKNKRQAISSMPGIDRFSVDLLIKDIARYHKLGGKSVILFGIPDKKDNQATRAFDSDGLIPKTVRTIKKNFPELVVMTDVCLCAYLTHGHCGIIKNGCVDNDSTLPLLGKMALAHAQAGADIVAPSDMMDFRVKQIRADLDRNHFINTIILSYAVKYSSAFYGPFRDAAHSAPEFGNRKSYQMDCGNAREALKEARCDFNEGADMIMVKPALAYLDIIALLRRELTIPIVAYSVSGEYSMIKAAAQKGWINEQEIVLENLTATKRAGADITITYHAKDILSWL